MIKTLSQQIKKGGYSDHFVSIAGNVTHFTATITEASIITHQQMHQTYLLFKLCFNNSH
jgi:hypothetical protein